MASPKVSVAKQGSWCSAGPRFQPRGYEAGGYPKVVQIFYGPACNVRVIAAAVMGVDPCDIQHPCCPTVTPPASEHEH
jgi:hypothetical protein